MDSTSHTSEYIPNFVSIILINWNGKPFLHDCIQSIQAQSHREYEVFIVDNCSTDGSQELLRQQYARHTLCLNQENLGYCKAANMGIRQACGEFILIMNPDVMLTPNFLKQMLTAARQDDAIGIVTGKLLRFDKSTLDSAGQFLRNNLSPLERGYGVADTGQYEQSEYVFSSCGAVVLQRRTMLEDIQVHGEYFDESYFAYYDDLDMGWRAQLHGWKAYYVPEAIAYHYRGGGLSQQQRQKQWFEYLPFIPQASFIEKPLFVQQHIMVNRYLTLLKNASWIEVLYNLPAILQFELLAWGYVICAKPRLLSILPKLITALPSTLRKRRDIQARRKVSAQYIRQYIRRDA